jgi:hypothetical protein
LFQLFVTFFIIFLRDQKLDNAKSEELKIS